jgi:hypothetical protein
LEMKAGGFLDVGCDLKKPELRRNGGGHGHQGNSRRKTTGPKGRLNRSVPP